MKIKKLIHHLLLTISLALGAIITGTTINAQAQQINKSTNNIKSNNQDISVNNNQINKPKSNLINIPNQNRVSPNSYNEDPKENKYNLNSSHINTARKYILYNSLKPKSNTNLNKSNDNYYKTNLNTVKYKANNIYDHILLSNIKKSNDLRLNNIQNNKSKNFVEYNSHELHNLGLPSIRLGSSTHKVRHQNWFRDGLNKRDLKARSWVSWHESNHRWQVLSYGHVCVGYFQLSPSYLGYKHGHVNLNKKHQVKVADAYVRDRYGNWINAKRFWEIHHWY